MLSELLVKGADNLGHVGKPKGIFVQGRNGGLWHLHAFTFQMCKRMIDGPLIALACFVETRKGYARFIVFHVVHGFSGCIVR
jgi:hypothetical protein